MEPNRDNFFDAERIKEILTAIKEPEEDFEVIIKNRKIFKKEWYGIFHIILKSCKEIHVDFQYYTVKYLGMEWYKKKIQIYHIACFIVTM